MILVLGHEACILLAHFVDRVLHHKTYLMKKITFHLHIICIGRGEDGLEMIFLYGVVFCLFLLCIGNAVIEKSKIVRKFPLWFFLQSISHPWWVTFCYRWNVKSLHSLLTKSVLTGTNFLIYHPTPSWWFTFYWSPLLLTSP